MEKTYEQKLDTYYVATITYLVVLIVYAVVEGTLIGERFELVWRDPIVYVIALCAALSLGALIVAVVLNKKVIVRENELVFRTRFKERVIRPEQIEWIAFRRGSRGRIRERTAERAARLKLVGRRRRVWLRPSGFTKSESLMNELRQWIERNKVQVKGGRRRDEGMRAEG